MTFTASVIREQGVTFALVLVKKHVVDSTDSAEDAIEEFSGAFPGMPVVLAAQDFRGRFTYFGRNDIVRFLSRVNPARIPWRKYSYA